MLTDKEKARLEFARQSVHSMPDNIIHPTADIDPSAKIGKDGFGWAKDENKKRIKVNHSGNVVICADVVIGPDCHIDRAVLTSTVIGVGNKLDSTVKIAHNAQIGEWNTFADGCKIEGSCEIGSYNEFGTGVIVQKKIKIGNNNLFGSGCVVTKDCENNGVYVGNPARLIRYK